MEALLLLPLLMVFLYIGFYALKWLFYALGYGILFAIACIPICVCIVGCVVVLVRF